MSCGLLMCQIISAACNRGTAKGPVNKMALRSCLRVEINGLVSLNAKGYMLPMARVPGWAGSTEGGQVVLTPKSSTLGL